MGASCLSYIASCDFHDLILRWGGYYRLMNPALARFLCLLTQMVHSFLAYHTSTSLSVFFLPPFY